MDTLQALVNIGPVLAGNLRAVGIDTPEALQALSAKEAFLRIRAAVDPGACLMQLYALEGARLGLRDNQLPADVKEDLKAFFKAL